MAVMVLSLAPMWGQGAVPDAGQLLKRVRQASPVQPLSPAAPISPVTPGMETIPNPVPAAPASVPVETMAGM